jgi:hypothetical protein
MVENYKGEKEIIEQIKDVYNGIGTLECEYVTWRSRRTRSVVERENRRQTERVTNSRLNETLRILSAV